MRQTLTKRPRLPVRQQQSGMTLLEVMVAVLILGFGMLSLGVLQAKSIAMVQSSVYRSVAADLGNDLADRIRAVRTPVMVTSLADVKPGKPPDFSKCEYTLDLEHHGAKTVCSNQETERDAKQTLVNAEMNDWFNALQAQLPNARYTLTQTAGAYSDYFRYTLTITWLDSHQENASGSYSVVIE